MIQVLHFLELIVAQQALAADFCNNIGTFPPKARQQGRSAVGGEADSSNAASDA